MQRRSLLRLGLATGAVLGLAGGLAAWWQPGLQPGAQPGVSPSRLSEPARQLWRAVAGTVLDGCLPTDHNLRDIALADQLQRLELTIAGLPPAMRAELSDLLALLGTAPGRYALTGLAVDWVDASSDDVARALQRLRQSGISLRLQTYHALRDLCNAAWFADAGTWDLLGYPGPQAV